MIFSVEADARGEARGRRWQYVLMLNFGFPVVFLLQEPPAAAWSGGAIVLALMAMYVGMVRRPQAEYALAVGMLAGISALALAWNPMYMYIAFLCAEPLSRASRRRFLAAAAAFALAAAAASANAGWWAQPQLLLALMPPVFGVCVLPLVIRASLRYKDMAVRLEAALSQVERLASDAERRRIAGELHDTLGHTLTFIALKAELAAKLAYKDAGRAAAEMEEVRGTARVALRQMRELVSGMRLVRLTDEIDACRSLFAAAGIDFAAEGDFASPAVTALQETILAMGLREAATNVVRHSRASACRVSLAERDGRLSLTVADDGAGFQPAAAPERAGSSGTGRAAMRERLQLIDGELTEGRSSMGGASVTFAVPIVLRAGRMEQEEEAAT